MQNKYIEPIVSLAIISAVFCIALFGILNQEQILNKQLRASVTQFNISEYKNKIGEQIVDKTEERVKAVVLADCLRKAYNDFLSQWNQECEELGLDEKCSLSKDIAEQLKDEYQNSEKTCYIK